jgi:hypothetical protein
VVSGTINTTWGPVTFTSVASRTITSQATENWGGWLGTSTALVEHLGTVTTTFGVWTASGLASTMTPVQTSATIDTDWGTWLGLATARARPADFQGLIHLSGVAAEIELTSDMAEIFLTGQVATIELTLEP